MSLWDDARTATLKSMWLGGSSGGHIARVMGMTRSQVLGKINRLFGSGSRPERPKPENTIKRAQRSRVVKPIPKASPEPQVIQGKPLRDLGKNDCRFPLGEGPYTFCAAPKWGDTSYCEHHASVCLIRGEKK